VSPADLMRFLFVWQHVAPSCRLAGSDGLRSVLEQLDGFEAPAAAWESAILCDRVEGYDPSLLDMVCLTGEVGWARLSSSATDAPSVVAATPIAIFFREHAAFWTSSVVSGTRDAATLDPASTAVLDALSRRGALFAHELAALCGIEAGDLQAALGRLVGAGRITADGFGGLRALMRTPTAGPRGPRRANVAGRWSLVGGSPTQSDSPADERIDALARAYLRRYGVVCRRLIAREPSAPPWRELTRVYRTLEARGEIRGGRFVTGLSGEQFALPEAVERLREVRRTPHDGRPRVVSAADPLNLTGVITSGERIRAVTTNRILYCDGVPLAVLEGEHIRTLAEVPSSVAPHVASALTGRNLPPVTSGFVGATRA